MSNYEEDLEKRIELLANEMETLTKINEILTSSVQAVCDTVSLIDGLIDEKIKDVEKRWEELSPILGSDEYQYMANCTKQQYKADQLLIECLYKLRLDISTLYSTSKENCKPNN